MGLKSLTKSEPWSLPRGRTSLQREAGLGAFLLLPRLPSQCWTQGLKMAQSMWLSRMARSVKVIGITSELEREWEVVAEVPEDSLGFSQDGRLPISRR